MSNPVLVLLLPWIAALVAAHVCIRLAPLQPRLDALRRRLRHARPARLC